MTAPPRVLALGESALRFDFATAIEPATIARVAAVARAIEGPERGIVHALGVVEVVPVGGSLLVRFAAKSEAKAVELRILELFRALEFSPDPSPPAPVVVPVVYDGPDLGEVAAAIGLEPEEVARRHLAADYSVAVVGFAPGFAYLAGLDPTLQLPRRASPRARVPAGAVAIGGPYAAVYPGETAGGWHWIGNTTWRPFEPRRTPPVALAVGGRVTFVAETR